jgi:hypothetical protein
VLVRGLCERPSGFQRPFRRLCLWPQNSVSRQPRPSFEESGVDQVAFIQQGGKNRHDHICQSLELFARKVLPEFEAQEGARAKRKQAELAPFIEQAMARKKRMAPFAEEEIPSFVALGRQVAANGPQLTREQEAMRRRMLAAAQIPLENPEKASAAE